MAKLFRKIHRKLLLRKEFISYLKYALGEIILLVIGILLALEVNNGNEYSKNSLKEKEILHQLHDELSENLENIYPAKENQLRSLEKGSIVQRNIKKMSDPISRGSVYQYADGMFAGHTYYPSKGVVESIINSGDFKHIQSDSFRNYLASRKDVISNYNLDTAIDLKLWTDEIHSYIIRNGDFLNLASEKNIKILKKLVFVNMLVCKQFYQNNIINSMTSKNGIEHYMEEIILLSAVH